VPPKVRELMINPVNSPFGRQVMAGFLGLPESRGQQSRGQAWTE
jgi:hypothetical protein